MALTETDKWENVLKEHLSLGLFLTGFIENIAKPQTRAENKITFFNRYFLSLIICSLYTLVPEHCWEDNSL